MNIAQIKQIDIVDFLKATGYCPVKETPFSAWFRAPYREDATPSFKVNKNRNIWFDFGTGQSGDIVDLGTLIYHTGNISRILKLIESATPGVPIKTRTYHSQTNGTDETFRNIAVSELSSTALKTYLDSRGIDSEIAIQECREIHYTCHGKPYFAIAFANIAEGYEVRNPFYKGCIAPKDVSIRSVCDSPLIKACCLFEGFCDYLSYLTMIKQGKITAPAEFTDFIILNSVNNLSKILPRMKTYKEIYCYLDNDDAGRKIVDLLREMRGKSVHDMMAAYPLYKDVNDLLRDKKKMP